MTAPGGTAHALQADDGPGRDCLSPWTGPRAPLCQARLAAGQEWMQLLLYGVLPSKSKPERGP